MFGLMFRADNWTQMFGCDVWTLSLDVVSGRGVCCTI